MRFLDLFTELCNFGLGQILNACIGVDPGSSENIVGGLAADPENIGQADLNALRVRDIYTSYTCHSVFSPLL